MIFGATLVYSLYIPAILSTSGSLCISIHIYVSVLEALVVLHIRLVWPPQKMRPPAFDCQVEGDQPAKVKGSYTLRTKWLLKPRPHFWTVYWSIR